MPDDIRELYQEVILDHGRHPRNVRHPPEANHQAHGNNPMCGDTLTVYLTLDDDGTIQDAAFERPWLCHFHRFRLADDRGG